jgi:hypothetical protein
MLPSLWVVWIIYPDKNAIIDKAFQKEEVLIV